MYCSYVGQPVRSIRSISTKIKYHNTHSIQDITENGVGLVSSHRRPFEWSPRAGRKKDKIYFIYLHNLYESPGAICRCRLPFARSSSCIIISIIIILVPFCSPLLLLVFCLASIYWKWSSISTRNPSNICVYLPDIGIGH